MDTQLVTCTYIERVVPLVPGAAARAFDGLLRELAASFPLGEAQLRLGAGHTHIDVPRVDVHPGDDLLLRAVPGFVRHGRIHRQNAVLELGRWSDTESVLGLRAVLRRTPHETDPTWLSYRAAGHEVLTAIGANLVRVATDGWARRPAVA